MIATIKAKYGQRARHERMVSATNTCSHDVWNIFMELIRTRFQGSMIFPTTVHDVSARLVFEVKSTQTYLHCPF
jgi:hypothetical protein